MTVAHSSHFRKYILRVYNGRVGGFQISACTAFNFQGASTGKIKKQAFIISYTAASGHTMPKL
jgi:hypothetical protein